jgi:RNA polymerase sigma-70 factor (ECF subfamily)
MQPDTANINISDEVLIQQCRDGDSAAMERLIIKYKDRLYNVILKICSNPHDAAELTQDAFVRIIENLHRFQARSSFYTWAFRIAVNLTLNFCRRQNRIEMTSLDAESGGNRLGHPADNQQAKAALRSYLADSTVRDPADIAQSKEQVNLIIRAINSLDSDHRAIIILRDIEDMNYEQIAQVLEIELGTVKSRLARARANLKANLEAIL